MSLPVESGQVIEVEVDDLAHQGDGVARYRGYVLFIPGTAAGDRVRAEVTRCGGSFGTARVRKILRPSPDRVDPRCEYYGRCGGCQLQHISYRAELACKRRWVRQTAERMAGASAQQVDPVIPSPAQYGYRERSRFGVRPSSAGEAVIGLRRRGSSQLVDIERCEIQAERNNAALRGIRTALRDACASAPHGVEELVIRSSDDDTLVLFVAASPLSQQLRRTSRTLLHSVSEITGAAVREGEGTVRALAGCDRLQFSLLGHPVVSSPAAFTQVNRAAAEGLYREVLRLLDPNADEVVTELFSGVGALSLVLAARADRVFAVDWDPAAVRDARSNAWAAGLDNITHLCIDAAESLRRIAEVRGADALILDPPRSGCSEDLLAAIADAGMPRMAYVSCHLGTWGRDVGRLRDAGWHLRAVVPVDMFPQTANVEIVSLLERD